MGCGGQAAGRVTLCFVETKQTTDAREVAEKETSHRVVGSVPLSGEARGTPGKRSGLLTALVYETSGIEPRGKSAGEKSRRKLEARGGEGDLPRALLSFDRTRRYKYFPRSFLPSSFFPGP